MPVSITGAGAITGISSLNTTVDATELGYLDGTTSAIQTQINAKAADSSQGLYICTPTSIANSGGSASASGGAVTFTGVSSVSLNGVFTSSYENYRILITANAAMTMRLRAGGTDNTSSNYADQYIQGSLTVVNAGRNAAATSWNIQGTASTSGLSIDLYGPALAAATYGVETAANAAASVSALFISMHHNVASAFDGFTISGTSLSGTVRVYGYKN